MRKISFVYDGVLRTASSNYKDVVYIYKLWYHECNRVFKDILLYEDDIETWNGILYHLYLFHLVLKFPMITRMY